MTGVSERPLSIDELLEDHICGQGEQITFQGLEEGLDTYNPAPFLVEDQVHLLGRVEPHHGTVSHLRYFVPNGSPTNYLKNPELPSIKLAEDPFIKRINGKIVQGVVKVRLLDIRSGLVEALHTAISYGDDFSQMQHLLYGPPGMKDIRPFQMPEEKVGVLTRPVSSLNGVKGVNLAVFNSLHDITDDALATAPPVPRLQAPAEYQHRGGNEGTMLDNGNIGYLGHIAWVGPEDGWDDYKKYYAETAQIDPESRATCQHKIIACPDCFPNFTPKKQNFEKVVFPQGIINERLYVGLGDAACGVMNVGNPYHPAKPMVFS